MSASGNPGRRSKVGRVPPLGALPSPDVATAHKVCMRVQIAAAHPAALSHTPTCDLFPSRVVTGRTADVVLYYPLVVQDLYPF